MNIYKTDVRPSIFDPKILVARCPKCDCILCLCKECTVCESCGEEIYVVDED